MDQENKGFIFSRSVRFTDNKNHAGYLMKRIEQVGSYDGEKRPSLNSDFSPRRAWPRRSVKNMSDAYHLYIPQGADTRISEVLESHGFQISSKTTKLADGNGTDYVVSKGKQTISIREAPRSEKISLHFLLCLSRPKNREMLMDVVTILKDKGARDDPE